MVRKMESKFLPCWELHLSSSREILKSTSTAFSSLMRATKNKLDLKSLMASFPTEAKCYLLQRGTDDCPTARVGKACSQQGHHTHSTLIERIVCCLFQLALQPLHTQSRHRSRESWQKPRRITKWWIFLGQERLPELIMNHYLDVLVRKT